MTIEELQRKSREIRALQQSNTSSEVVSPTEDESSISELPSIDKLRLQSKAYRDAVQDSDYSNGVINAGKEGEWITHEFDRNKLYDWAKYYSDEMSKNAENEQLSDYYKNQILLDKVKEQIKRLGGGASFDADFGAEISVGVRNSMADLLLSGQKLYEDLPIHTDTNVESYYLKALYENNGKVRGTRNEYTEKSVVQNLSDLKNAYPDDDLIQKLYATVIERKYNVGSDSYFNSMSQYATEKLKELRYKESLIYKNTRDEKEELERLKNLEELSGYGDIAKGILGSTGVVANMGIPIAIGAVTGGIGEVAGASSGTIGTLTQAGTIGSMGASAYGNAFDRTLGEGYGWNKSGDYAGLVMLTEMGTEVLGGEAIMATLGGFASHTVTSKVAQKLISKGKTPLAKFMIGMAWDVGAEATEEMIAEALEPLYSRAILGKEITAEEYWRGILESARDSILPTLIMGGFGKARIVNHVTKIDTSLRTQLAELRAKNAITQQEYDAMKKELTDWTNDAIAGVTEHYEEIKTEVDKKAQEKGITTQKVEYGDAMQNMQNTLNTRGKGINEILQQASSLSKIESMTTEEKQKIIEDTAKKYNITNEKLVELYNEFPNVMKDVLPSTYEQAQNTELNLAIGTNMVENIKSEINSKIDGTNKKAITLDILNSGNSKNEKPIENYNEKFLELAKVNTPRKRDSGVVRIEINDNRSLADFKLGNFDESKKPTTQEINSSPILIESLVKDDASAENGEPTRKLYVYDNFDDFEKDVVASFGSIGDFLNGRSNTVNTVITMSGKGGYEMSVEDGKVVWKNKSGETKINDNERTVEPSKKKKRKSRTTSEDTREMLEDSKDTNYEKKDGFYSQVEKVIATKMPNRANGETIMNLLTKNGAKQDELNWLDMDTFLNSKAFFTKQEVLDYIRANQLDLKEIRNEVKHDKEREDNAQQRLEELTHIQAELEDKLEELEDKAVRTFRRNDISDFEMRDVRRLFNHIRDGETTLEEEFDVDALVDNLYAYGFGDMSEEEIDDYIASEVQNYEDVIKAIQPIYDEWFEAKEALFSVEAELDELDEEDYAEDTTKFSGFATKFEGGSNYREVLFTLPNFEGKPFYVKQHWGNTPNVVAHTRLQDYTDDSGNDVLFIEEVQSDMHQQGRDKGYSDQNKIDSLRKEQKEVLDKKYKLEHELWTSKESQEMEKIRNEVNELWDKMHELQNNFNNKYDNVPTVRDLFDYIDSNYPVDKLQYGTSDDKDYYKKQAISDIIRDNYGLTDIQNDTHDYISKAIDDYIELKNEIDKIWEQRENLREKLQEMREAQMRSPNAIEIGKLETRNSQIIREIVSDSGIDNKFPFKKTWHEFVLRKIINEAVNRGYDKVAWTTGIQQSERYTSLLRHIEAIDYSRNQNGTYDVLGTLTNGNQTIIGTGLKAKELEDIVGKDITNQIISGEYDTGKGTKGKFVDGKEVKEETITGKISGANLTIGSEGMRGFYDKIIPEYLNKYLKKWNSKVEDVVIDGNHQMGFTITPEMKEAVENEGQVLFEAKDDVAKSKKPLYNQGRGDLNEERTYNGRTRQADMAGKDKLGKIIENERRESEKKLKNIKTKDILSKSNIINDYEKTHNNVVDLIIGDEPSFTDSQGNIHLNEQQIAIFGEEQLIKHELVENLLANHTNEVMNDFYPLIKEILQNSKGITTMFKNYSYGLKSVDRQKLALNMEKIAKETFCDFYASTAENDVAKDLRRILIERFGTDLYNEIITTIENKDNQIYSLKNSNQSSFSSPKNIFMDMLTDIEAMYKMSDMEKKGSPVLETTDMINKGELPRQEGRNETSRVEITNMIKNFLKGKFGKLRGMKRKTAYGTHNRESGWVRLGEVTNIDTAFHELGHYINTTALKDKVDFDRSIKDELIKLCEARWPERYKGETRLREGFAEAIRNWVEDREVFTINNPELVKFFEEQRTKSKELEDAFGFLEQLHEKVIDYENMTELQKARALRRNDTKEVNVDSMLRRMGTRIIFNTFNDAVYANKFDRFRAKVFGKKYADMLSIDKLEDTIKLAGNRDQTLTQLREGFTNWNTGKKITHGLRAITEVVMPTKQQAKELGMKYDDLYAQNLDDAGLYAQLKRMEYLYESERDIENLGLRKQEVEEAIKQLTDETALSKKQLDEFTKMVNEDSKALINYAYEQRKISAEERDNLLTDNQFYAPLNRITESEALGKNERRRNTKRAFYRLEGSDLQLENPFVALASNWGSIIRAIDENNVYITFANMLKEVGDAGGDYGLWAETNVTPEMKFKGSIDLKAFEGALRTQFKQMEKAYGINLYDGDLVKLMNLDATASLFGLADINEAERIVSYTDNGVRKYIQFADNDWGRGMFDLLTGVNNVSGDFYTSVAQELNAGLKMGATAMNMEFALGNMQSDAMMRYLTSDTDFIHRVYFPVITNVINAINYMKHRGEWLPNWHPTVESEMYKKFEQSGVAQSGKFQSNLENLKKDRAKAFGDASDAIFKNVRKTKKFRKPSEVLTESKLGEFLSWIPEISEQATRFAEFSGVYNKMIKDGKSEAVAIREATIKARQVTQDFTVQGKMMRSINKVVPFASATVGGLYRMSQEARNHPERFTARMGGLALMALIISSLIKDDDREWYEEINEQKRYDNFILPNLLNPDDKQHPMIIKKPQGPARAFVNLVQMLYDAGMGYVSEDEADEVFKNWLVKSYEEINPVNDVTDFVPGALVGFLENKVNLDFYYGNAIVPKELQNLDPRNQYDDTTSEFAKHIGKIFNWSPKKIDNAWEQMFAGTGKQFTNLYSDIVRLITGTENPLPAKDQSEHTFGSRVYVNALKNPTSVNKVYERIEELEREKAEGRMTDEQEAEYAKLQEAKSALAQISKQIKANRTDSSKTRKEKKARLDELQLLRADTARYYLGKTLLGKDSANNVELISFYPSNDKYTYTVGKNKYEVSFEDEAVKKEYAEMFKKEYEANLKKLRATAEYKKASTAEKAELEKKAKSNARTATTNKMKKIVYQRTK